MDAVRQLYKAIEDGDLRTVTALLRANAYMVAERGEYDLTPLHRAAMAGHAEIVRRLLDHSAAPDARDYGGGAPLHWAAARGNRDAAAALLDGGADANARDLEQLTPLHRAAGEGREAVAALLLARGADPNARGQISGTPLHAAAEKGHGRMVELLLAHGALANARSGGSYAPWTPWDAARAAGHGAIAELLREHGGQDRGAAAIGVHRAAEHGYLGRLALLVDGDPALVASRDFLYRRTPLHWAAARGHQAAAELLLAHGADLAARDKSGRTPLELARAEGRQALADLLQRSGASSG
jgi:ankyrin repeat protein